MFRRRGWVVEEEKGEDGRDGESRSRYEEEVRR